MRIYLAGPLFSVAERDFNARLADQLRLAGHEVFVPQEIEQRSKTARQMFEGDVAGIDWCEVVLANMDGPDPDSGTAWECGYAFGRKAIVVFRTDFRAAEEPGKAPFNLMLSESATRCLDLAASDKDLVVDFKTVAAAILRALAELTQTDLQRP